MAFDDITRDRDPYSPTPSSRPSGGFDGTGIVLLLAIAIGGVLIMMSYPGVDGHVGLTKTTSPTFKTPPPPSESTSPAEPTPKPITEPTPKPATEPLPDPTTEPTPNPPTEPRPTQAPIP
jgi:hypothetical protein